MTVNSGECVEHLSEKGAGLLVLDKIEVEMREVRRRKGRATVAVDVIVL